MGKCYVALFCAVNLSTRRWGFPTCRDTSAHRLQSLIHQTRFVTFRPSGFDFHLLVLIRRITLRQLQTDIQSVPHLSSSCKIPCAKCLCSTPRFLRFLIIGIAERTYTALRHTRSGTSDDLDIPLFPQTLCRLRIFQLFVLVSVEIILFTSTQFRLSEVGGGSWHLVPPVANISGAQFAQWVRTRMSCNTSILTSGIFSVPFPWRTTAMWTLSMMKFLCW